MIVAAAPSPLWYLSRGTGAVTLVLLTATVVLGIAGTLRWRPAARLPRFLVDGLHRNLSLLVVLLLSAHVLTAVLDPFAHLRALDAVVPLAAVVPAAVARARSGRVRPGDRSRGDQPGSCAPRPARLAGGPLARVRVLAGRVAARPRDRNRREHHLAAGAGRALRGRRHRRRRDAARALAGLERRAPRRRPRDPRGDARGGRRVRRPGSAAVRVGTPRGHARRAPRVRVERTRPRRPRSAARPPRGPSRSRSPRRSPAARGSAASRPARSFASSPGSPSRGRRCTSTCGSSAVRS